MGCLPIDRDSFDRWEKRYDDFLADFQSFVDCMSTKSGLELSLTPRRSKELGGYELSEVRKFWLLGQRLWLDRLTKANGTKELSQKKLCAILLWFITEHRPFTVGESTGGGDEYLRKRIQDGQSAYLGWLLIYEICDYYEANREAKEKYIPRVTEEFETDFVSNLLNGNLNTRSIHLVLKALFLRDI